MPDEVITDLAQIQRHCLAKDAENTAFQTFVKLELALSDRQLNAIVSETTSQVWKHIDCRTWASYTQRPVSVVRLRTEYPEARKVTYVHKRG